MSSGLKPAIFYKHRPNHSQNFSRSETSKSMTPSPLPREQVDGCIPNRKRHKDDVEEAKLGHLKEQAEAGKR